jgi:hypothetical protein
VRRNFTTVSPKYSLTRSYTYDKNYSNNYSQTLDYDNSLFISTRHEHYRLAGTCLNGNSDGNGNYHF